MSCYKGILFNVVVVEITIELQKWYLNTINGRMVAFVYDHVDLLEE